MNNLTFSLDLLAELNNSIKTAIETDGVAILPPMDVIVSIQFVNQLGLKPKVTMLDPWYNKGVGGVRDDYQAFIINILDEAKSLSDHIFLWGFPEIVAQFIDKLPNPLSLVAWLTWYYKNNPSVIRGWRSSQMACLHIANPGAKLFPEHFLNQKQLELKENGKLRYMPGPTSVIESALMVGFVGKKEQTGHPSQKPIAVFEQLFLMTTNVDDLIFDPMSGSGTTAATAIKLKRCAIICDHSEEFTQMAEKRFNTKRINLPPEIVRGLNSNSSASETNP